MRDLRSFCFLGEGGLFARDERGGYSIFHGLFMGRVVSEDCGFDDAWHGICID